MLGSLWEWLVGGVVTIGVLGGLRFELVDFLLDRVGALVDLWPQGERPEPDGK